MVTGKVLDGNTGQSLPFAGVVETDALGNLVGSGTRTNEHGDFVIMPKSEYLTFKMVGCQQKTYRVGNVPQTINLSCGTTLDEFVVKPKKETNWTAIGSAIRSGADALLGMKQQQPYQYQQAGIYNPPQERSNTWVWILLVLVIGGAVWYYTSQKTENE